MKDAFDRLAPYLQDYIYRNQWAELREVQVAACDVIFQTDHHLLLSTGTASGKTEAAFLPALTILDEQPSSSVGILYISPLKALINDQFARLDLLLEESGISVCKWHGEASLTEKNRLLRRPQGVLQITPESLQSLMINKREAIVRLFSDLRFVVIDEVHSFMGGARGIQLICLLQQIERFAGCTPRRIGLSATLSDYSVAEGWLCGGTDRKCVTPRVAGGKRMLHLAMRRFVTQGAEEEEDRQPDTGKLAHYEYLYTQTLNRKAIIFAKARAEVEMIMANVRRVALRRKTKDVYRVHHGSISATLREEAEQEMKLSEEKIVTGATVTLELGMDIGALDRVIQVGAPYSASSFTQRIGRCGRRGQPAELLFTFEEEALEKGTHPMKTINWAFLKTIAIIQLFLEERWVEPVMPARHPYALVYHQTMAYLVSAGEVSAAQLAQHILTLAPFRHISQEDYRLLLQHLLAIGHLERTERGGLLMGQEAEFIVGSYDFYSVFEAMVEYLVKEGNQSVGTVMEAYPTGTRFALAGRAWESVEVDEQAKIIFVKKIEGVSKIGWTGLGFLDLHPKLMKKIHEVLISTQEYAYLDDDCKQRLTQIRDTARNGEIGSSLVTKLGNQSKAILPWLGTRQLTALSFALAEKGISSSLQPEPSLPVYLEVKTSRSSEELEQLIRELCSAPIDKNDFVLPNKIQLPDKYQSFIPQELLAKQFLEDYLDVEGLKELGE